MTLIFVRLFFVILSSLVGYQLGVQLMGPESIWAWFGLGIGVVVAIFVVGIDLLLTRVTIRSLSCIVLGILFGLLVSSLFMKLVVLIPLSKVIEVGIRLALLLVFSYLGIAVILRGQDELNLIIPYVKFAREDRREEFIILDTSVIIDGRIADICETKFIEGRFIIPRFVLRELQSIADSPDTLKRNRGRRGLDILGKIQKSTGIDVKIHEADFPEVPEVDGKLVKLAKILGAKIFTNDYNLNKVAEIQGVPVMNINELANALKPVVLPGEVMEVRIVKEGKEYGQGVAYLDDGTMIVVEGGRDKIGSSQKVSVTSVLQTLAGRMIFAKLGTDRG